MPLKKKKPVKSPTVLKKVPAVKRSAATVKRSSTYQKRTVAAQPKTLRDHAQHIVRITPKFVHGAVAGAVIGVFLVTTFGSTTGANAFSVSVDRDCDDYAVINCGALSTDELKDRYSRSGVADIYNYFDISAANIKVIDKTAVKGIIYDDGSVKVDGNMVATDAITAARKDVNGSDPKTYSGTTFYVRHLKDSWSHQSSPAYVVMKDGVFDYAILAACGNPIKATPKSGPKSPTPPPPAPSPTPKSPTTPPPAPSHTTPTPPAPTSTPPAPAPTPTPTPPAEIVTTPAESTTSLPNTGPGLALVLIAGLSVLGGFLTHHAHRHVTRKMKARKLA